MEDRIGPAEGSWRAQADALVQAASGGMLFGIPLLYTLEVWEIGGRTGPLRLLGTLAVAAVPIFLLNRTAGFRTRRDRTVVEALGDTVVALAVALVSTAVVMTLLRELSWDARFDDSLGKVVFGAVAVGLGVSISRHLLAGSRQGTPEEVRVLAQAMEPARSDRFGGGRPRARRWRLGLEVEVTNAGGTAAEQVQVIAEVELPEGGTESGEQVVDQLGPGEVASLGFTFSIEPTGEVLRLRAASHTSP